MSRRATSRRAAMTMVEVSISIVFVALFAVYVASAMWSAGLVNRDTLVDNDVALLGNDLADAVATHVSGAARVLGASATDLRVQAEYDLDGDGALTNGVWIDGANQDGWSIRLQWVDDGLDLSEAAVDVDVNGDGDVADTVDLGHLEVQHLDGGGNVFRRIPIGRGRVHVVGGAMTRAETGAQGSNGLDDDLDGRIDEGGGAEPLRLFSRVGAPATTVQTADRAVQLNLVLAHVPTVGAGGRPDVRMLHVMRVIALRGGGQ